MYIGYMGCHVLHWDTSTLQYTSMVLYSTEMLNTMFLPWLWYWQTDTTSQTAETRNLLVEPTSGDRLMTSPHSGNRQTDGENIIASWAYIFFSKLIIFFQCLSICKFLIKGMTVWLCMWMSVCMNVRKSLDCVRCVCGWVCVWMWESL